MNEMLGEKQFWDSNLWVYLFLKSGAAADVEKQNKVLERLEKGPDITVSVQVLNEVANVLMKKCGFDEAETEEAIDVIEGSANLVSMTRELTSDALLLKKQYSLSWFDALICAAALSSGCDQLLTEDLQHGLVVDGKLTVLNPFLV